MLATNRHEWMNKVEEEDYSWCNKEQEQRTLWYVRLRYLTLNSQRQTIPQLMKQKHNKTLWQSILSYVSWIANW